MLGVPAFSGTGVRLRCSIGPPSAASAARRRNPSERILPSAACQDLSGLCYSTAIDATIPLVQAKYKLLGLQIPGEAVSVRTLGGTPNRDPCSFWGLIWGLPRDIGVI